MTIRRLGDSKEAGMVSRIKGRGVRVYLRIALCLWTVSSWTTTAASAQTIMVDAGPSHVANTFSPVYSLGGAVDRLKTGTPDHLLTDPGLKASLRARRPSGTSR